LIYELLGMDYGFSNPIQFFGFFEFSCMLIEIQFLIKSHNDSIVDTIDKFWIQNCI